MAKTATRPTKGSDESKTTSSDKKVVDYYEILKKAFTFDGRWDKDTFPEFPDVLFCIRQLIGLIFGITYGVTAQQGYIAIIKFVAANMFISFFYYARYVNVNIDDFGAGELGKGETIDEPKQSINVLIIAVEGFQSSVGLFFLSWILVYSGLHTS